MRDTSGSGSSGYIGLCFYIAWRVLFGTDGCGNGSGLVGSVDRWLDVREVRQSVTEMHERVDELHQQGLINGTEHQGLERRVEAFYVAELQELSVRHNRR